MLLEELKQCVRDWKLLLKKDMDALHTLLTSVDSAGLNAHDVYHLVQKQCIPMKIFGTQLWFGVGTYTNTLTRNLLKEQGLLKKTKGPDGKLIDNPKYSELKAMETYSNVATRDQPPAFQFKKGVTFFIFIRNSDGKVKQLSSERFQLDVEQICEGVLAFRLEKLEEMPLEEFNVPGKPETSIKWKDIVGALLVLMSQSNVKFVYTHPVTPLNKKREELNQILQDLFGFPMYLREAKEGEMSAKFWEEYQMEQDQEGGQKTRPMIPASEEDVISSNSTDNPGWVRKGEGGKDSYPIYRCWEFNPDWNGEEVLNKKQRVEDQAGASSQ